MRRPVFGTTEKTVSVIGQGTWKLPERGNARTQACRALLAGIDAGMTHIDTAELYGRAEELIGETIGTLPREEIFLVSKVMPSNASYKGVLRAAETSLRSLRTDYLDCYLLHWRGSHPLSVTFEAFETLKKDGKILSFGVSNFDVGDMEETEKVVGKNQIACNQVLYNLESRGIERNLIPYCQKRNIAVVGYTPFGSVPREGSQKYDMLNKIAAKYTATPRQVILAFLTRLSGVFAIPKSSKELHVRENAKAGSLTLDASDLEEIEKLYPVPSYDVPLEMI